MSKIKTISSLDKQLPVLKLKLENTDIERYKKLSKSSLELSTFRSHQLTQAQELIKIAQDRIAEEENSNKQLKEKNIELENKISTLLKPNVKDIEELEDLESKLEVVNKSINFNYEELFNALKKRNL